MLRRTLSTFDLVLAQILIVVGLNWFGPAARLGSLHAVYWLVAILFFHFPLAAVVVHLTKAIPLEGGPYQWAKAAYGETAGFLVAWNFWLFIMCFIATLGLSTAQAIGYARNAPVDAATTSVIIVSVLVILGILGFTTSKWLHNAASAALLLTALLIIVLPFASSRELLPRPEVEAFSLMQLVLFTRIAVYALAGLEGMAVVTAETRDGARSIARATFIAAPCIAAIYILGTESVLRFVKPTEIDLVNPAAHAFATAFGGAAASAAILLLVVRDFAQASQAFAVSSRMPLVAGWDRLLPAWFTRLHPRWRTPVTSIVFAGAVVLIASLTAVSNAERQEAFQILQSTAGVFFATTYLVMFSIPLLGRIASPPMIRIAALFGFVVTLVFCVLLFVPIVEVRSTARFATIIGAAVLIANALGLLQMKMPRLIRKS